MNKTNKKKMVYFFAVITLFAALAVFVISDMAQPKTGNTYMKYGEFIKLAEEGKVSSATLSDGPNIIFELDEEGVTYETDNPRNTSLKETLLLYGVDVAEGSYTSGNSIVSTVISVVFFAGAIFLMTRMMGKQGGNAVLAMNVAEAKTAGEAKMYFDDIAGNDEAKESVQDVVDFIKSPEKYAGYGARMPHGVLFYGPPGTGKTLMAKAVAGEAGVPFFAVSGSDFVQMYVGVGASRVRSLFKKARESGKAVIFIDEIDALGKKRGMGITGGTDERDQTLNALLTEMSGFQSGEGIVVIAATNRLDTLDEALLRPGRFDRQVEIGLPDLSGRERILRLHSKNKPVSEDVSISELARQTVYFSGAMLENLMNEAAICAAKKGAGAISDGDVEEAYYTIVAGKAKKDRSGVKERDRKITAFHEAGHALAAKIKAPENTVAKITIIPSVKGAGGFCINIPPDKLYFTKAELEAQVLISLAGRAAEELVFGEENVTTGASNDLEKAAAIVKDLISKYGMSKTAGLAPLGEAALLDECRTYMERLYTDAKNLLSDSLDALKRIAHALLLKETLNEAELDGLVEADYSN